jgi:hypothetical protein
VIELWPSTNLDVLRKLGLSSLGYLEPRTWEYPPSTKTETVRKCSANGSRDASRILRQTKRRFFIFSTLRCFRSILEASTGGEKYRLYLNEAACTGIISGVVCGGVVHAGVVCTRAVGDAAGVEVPLLFVTDFDALD